MARTKITSRKSTGGKAPRKQLASDAAIRKRRTPENDDYSRNDGTATKRMKLSTSYSNSISSTYEISKKSHEDTSSSSSEDMDTSDTSSSSSESSSDISSVSNKSSSSTYTKTRPTPTNIQTLKTCTTRTYSASMDIHMTRILKEIKTIFNAASYNPSQQKQFTQSLVALSSDHEAKLTELEYRRGAVTTFLTNFQNKMENGSPYRFSSYGKDYFNKKMYKFSQSMLMGFRFKATESRDEWDYYTTHYTDYSMDFALRSVNPHAFYVRRMYLLLRNDIHDIKDLCNIICSYAHNGYRWYRMQATVQTDFHADTNFSDINDGLLYNLRYNEDDYFMDYEYYKEPQEKCFNRNTIGKLKLSMMRKQLGTRELAAFTDDQFSCFIVAVALVELDIDALEDMEEWVKVQHQ